MDFLKLLAMISKYINNYNIFNIFVELIISWVKNWTENKQLKKEDKNESLITVSANFITIN